MSRSDKRRIATQKGEPMPTFLEHGTDETDIDRSKYLFEELKREGEGYKHSWEAKIYQDLYRRIIRITQRCQLCGLEVPEGIRLPDGEPMNFFAPSSDKQGWIQFGFLWRRGIEQAWWGEFLIFQCEFLLADFISCAPLAEALYLWFKEGKEKK